MISKKVKCYFVDYGQDYNLFGRETEKMFKLLSPESVVDYKTE